MNQFEINPSYYSLKEAGMRLFKKYIRWGFSTICIKTEKEKTDHINQPQICNNNAMHCSYNF